MYDACRYVSMYMSMYAYVYICTRVCLYVYTYMYHTNKSNRTNVFLPVWKIWAIRSRILSVVEESKRVFTRAWEPIV